ncbi:MAG: hypothetical protein JSU86_08015 [Phycisphaerales bacterium]|nr:MAG: hypothetical protein JSU86_08015 [Phycisphaerales bacterium]
MRALTRLWKWWHELWDCDSLWWPDVDTHAWANKVEILRRLSKTAP